MKVDERSRARIRSCTSMQCDHDDELVSTLYRNHSYHPLYLKFLPSAHSLPSTMRSQAIAASKNSLSALSDRSIFLYVYDSPSQGVSRYKEGKIWHHSQSGATSMTPLKSGPRQTIAPEMIESFALPSTPIEPNRYFREASSRLKKPPIYT